MVLFKRYADMSGLFREAMDVDPEATDISDCLLSQADANRRCRRSCINDPLALRISPCMIVRSNLCICKRKYFVDHGPDFFLRPNTKRKQLQNRLSIIIDLLYSTK